MPEKTAEILAHITAPSSESDDTRYRTLVQAYLDFEPAAHVSLAPATPQRSHVQPVEHLRCPDSSQPGEFPSFISSAELSFGSASNNLASPRLAVPPTTANPGEASESSWQPPPSLVDDSMPDNNPTMPQFCSPTRILEYFLSGFESSQPTSLPSADGPMQATATPPPTEVIPQSPIMGPKHGHAAGYPRPLSDGETIIPCSNEHRPAPTASSIAAIPPPSSRADSEPPGNKRRRGSAASESPGRLGRSSSDIGPRQSQAREQVRSSEMKRLRRSCLSLDGLELRAPDPPVSCRDMKPSMMVTEQLAKLARDADIDRHFMQPRIQVRELRPFERGHWYLDFTGWDMAKRQEIWRFLTNYIGAGEAGWGIWCKRDGQFSFGRLYCWAHIAGHMYLVLYLATKRDILYKEVSWIGSDERPAITMPPRKRSFSAAKAYYGEQ